MPSGQKPPVAFDKERQHGRDSSLSDRARGRAAALPTFHRDHRAASQSGDICDHDNSL